MLGGLLLFEGVFLEQNPGTATIAERADVGQEERMSSLSGTLGDKSGTSLMRPAGAVRDLLD